MSNDRFPELNACNAAQKAVEEFDARHRAKEEAIKQVAKMLERGGWGSVKVGEARTTDPRYEDLGTDMETEPLVSVSALRGDSIESIVKQRQALVREWEQAYASVPEQIRTSARGPGTGKAIRSRHPRRR